MPYIASSDRPALDKAVETLANEISRELSNEMNGDTEISQCYRDAFLRVASTLCRLERNTDATRVSRKKSAGEAERLAMAIFSSGERHEYRGAWLGGLNYSLTRLIQVVPAKMVATGTWKEEFRYWLYAQTVGALERSAFAIHSRGKDDWIHDGIVGVLVDIKDEYKRRVNSAYEAVQIAKSGDCYTTPYRTELESVSDEKGNVTGYREVMRDFRVSRPERAPPARPFRPRPHRT